MRICVLMALLWTAMAMESAETKLTDGHWAYQKPVRPALPRTDSDWPRNAIDFFVLHRLETNNLRPSPAASPEQLLRRVHLDLIGLPPSPAVVDAFLANPTDAAYETIVDDLLKSKRYGERWARPWLDLARYADSNGFQADQLRDSWAYRDWVINAFNSGMPFNQFVTEQIAGDMLPSATSAQRVATGFHRTPTCNVEAGVHPEENRVNQVIDRVNTTGTVFLGTTLECAQCHNHKYDPFSIEDYYSIFAFFNNTPLEVKQQGNGVTWNFYGPTMNLPISTEQQTKLKDLNTRKEAAVKRVSELKKAAKTEQLAWEKQTLRALKESPQWTVLAIEKFDATGNPEHELQKDGSILVTGKNPDKSTYTFHAKADLKRITAIRLEALTHPSMNKGGPGRNKAPVENPNFIVNEFQVETGSKMVKFASVKASFSQNHWAVAGSIDNDLKTGWAITPAFGKPAWAIYRLAEPLELKSEAKLKFTIIQNYGGGRTIGRPRLSAIDGNPNALDLPTDIAVILKKTKRTKKDDDTLAKHFLKESPKLKAEEQTITAIDKQIAAIKPASTLVMVEQDRARETHVMLRGQYLSPGDKINPGTPSILHPMEKTLPRNRLGFSKWLTDPTNPLIGRVTS